MGRKWRRIRAMRGDQLCVVGASLVLLPVIQFLLRVRGLKRTAAALARHSDHPSGSIDIATATSMADAVSVVAGRKMVGALCLGRSLLLWFLLRRRGMDAVLVVGADAATGDDWEAHAWVELNSVPVNDVADVRIRYGSFGLDLPRLRPASFDANDPSSSRAE
jgi:Transglutaminase-like superfamily